MNHLLNQSRLRNLCTNRLTERKLFVILIAGTLASLIVILRQLPSSGQNEMLMKAINSQNGQKKRNEDNLNLRKKVFYERDIRDVRLNHDRREKVKEMMLFAWNGYKKYAWGKNELRPISKRWFTSSIFGEADDLGVTIIDAMDTLLIMNLQTQVNEAVEWVRNNFSIIHNARMSTFEVNIRVLGGLLSMHSLTNNKFFLEKADEVGRQLLPAFNSLSGIPYSRFNPIPRSQHDYEWIHDPCSVLAEFGSFSLEFQYLTDHTGQMVYESKIDGIYKVLENLNTKGGYYFNYANPKTGEWCGKSASIGSGGDSFYEYLLKHWIIKGKNDDQVLEKYVNAMGHVYSHLLKISVTDLRYMGEYENGFVKKQMSHLACFSGGLFALTAMSVPREVLDEHRETFEFDIVKMLAAEITQTCHEAYVRNPTHLGPEIFGFDSPVFGSNEPFAKVKNYALRPEVAESYFYMWRLTKDRVYRDWAWDLVESLEKNCRTDDGFTGLHDVTYTGSLRDDVQPSYFLAETLKYLFLIFCDDDMVPLDKFVFNTEGHPLLIRTV